LKEKTVTYRDQVLDEDTIMQISDLRQERWALYAALSLQPTRKKGTVFTQKMITRIERRIKVVNAMLFELTKNEVYNVTQSQV
jgi:hypothetical protein